MQNATKKSESDTAAPAERAAAPSPKKAKLSVLLITRDDQLWPQIGAHLGKEFILKQVDSLDELLTCLKQASSRRFEMLPNTELEKVTTSSCS